MRADAHVDVFALLIEADHGILGKVTDVLLLVLALPLMHEGHRLIAGKDE